MKKTLLKIFPLLLILGLFLSPHGAAAGEGEACGQVVLEFLMPGIGPAVHDYYREYFYDPPAAVPYYGGRVLDIRHRDSDPAAGIPYSYEVTVEVLPYFGPHIAVGRDRLTFGVFAGGRVALERFEHVESFEIPPHYREMIIGKWPPE